MIFRCNQGQAMLIVIFIIAGLLVLTSALGESINMVVDRIELQNLADGSALRSGNIMADGLNLIAITNGMLVGAGISVFFSKGATLKWVRSIQRLQDQVIRTTPLAATLAATTYGVEQKATAIGFTVTAPEMRVARHYWKILWFKKIPVWCKDSGKPERRKTVVTWILPGDRRWVTTAASRPTGGRLIGEFIIWPLPSPKYQAYLVKSFN